MVFVWGGRHGQPGVVGEQGDDGRDVARGERFGETGGQLAFPRAVGQLDRFAVDPVAAQLLAGALQRALHRGGAGAEHGRDLVGGKAEDITQQQHRRLAGR
ncbi:Uncharacterised protein [Mycobacteroides abscessus subsp. abscessus]|nr:Uncharacterised protein [Mycobacteroides abscessus subsp. abscessus]